MSRFLPFALALILTGLTASPAKAHPHAWIDYRTRVVLSADGKIVALKQHWVFDEYYTEFATQDFDPSKKGHLDHEELMRLADENLKNLTEFDYFTQIEQDGKPVKVKKPEAVDSYLVKGHIALDFTLPLIAPADPFAHKVTYRIYDPSYYISMLHDKVDAIAFEGPKTEACSFDLFTPKPDIMKINFASSIDKNGHAPNQLGSFFAQKVTLKCK